MQFKGVYSTLMDMSLLLYFLLKSTLFNNYNALYIVNNKTLLN